MTISVTCSQCGKVIKAPDGAAGRKGKCPSCGAILEIPTSAAPAGEPAKGAPPEGEDPLAALAQAAEQVAEKGPSAAEALAAEIARPKPVKPAAAPKAPPAEVPPAAEEPAAPVPARTEADEVIAVEPVGVQTPSGIPSGGSARVRGHRWQRKLAGYARVAGLTVSGICLVLGIVIMIMMAMRGREMLVPGIGAFIFMVVVGLMSALGGLLARHMLIILADLGEDLRRQQGVLDHISDRLE